MRTVAAGQAQIAELESMRAIRNAMSSARWPSFKNIYAHGSPRFKTALISTLMPEIPQRTQRAQRSEKRSEMKR
jgi:hypothetical protein